MKSLVSNRLKSRYFSVKKINKYPSEREPVQVSNRIGASLFQVPKFGMAINFIRGYHLAALTSFILQHSE
jgi:hypothetical protein